MYKIEIDRTLRRIIRLIYQFGVWKNEEKSDFRKSCTRLSYLLEHTLLLFFILTCGFLSDKNELSYLVPVEICGAVQLIKLWFLLYRKDEILQFLYDPTVIHCIADYDESVEVKKKIEPILKFIQVYTWVFATLVFSINCANLPIFTSEKMLPLFIHFDVECDYEMILYWVTYILTAIGVVLCVIYSFLSVFIWYIMLNYSIEYKILGNQFRRLGYKTKKTSRNSFHRDLMDLIEAQKKLFDTVERFRSCFSKLFLVEIFTGALSICCSTYNLAYGTAENLLQMAYFVVILLYSFFNIFLLMYLANEITIKSARLPYCLFESNWTAQSEATKKCVIILCEMIKHPQELKVFIYPMNLEKFLSIVNGAYSMFNVLQNFNIK